MKTGSTCIVWTQTKALIFHNSLTEALDQVSPEVSQNISQM